MMAEQTIEEGTAPEVERPGSGEHTAADARAHVRAELDASSRELATLRAQRDTLNDRIRTLAAHVDTLRSAVALFDRRARAEADAARPVRRRAKGATS